MKIAVKAKNEKQHILDKANAKAMQCGTKSEAQAAFNQIYKRYKNAILFEVVRLVGLDNELAKDLTQEIFIKVFEKIDQYNYSVALSTWLYSIAKNHAIDHKRRQKVEVMSVESLALEYSGDEEVSDVSFQLEDKSANTFQDVVRKERANAVMDAINNGVKTLDAKQIVTLLFLEDMSYEKVAEHLEMPIGTIKAVMFRAKAEMKKYLTNKSRDFEYGRIRKAKLKITVEAEIEEEMVFE